MLLTISRLRTDCYQWKNSWVMLSLFFFYIWTSEYKRKKWSGNARLLFLLVMTRAGNTFSFTSVATEPLFKKITIPNLYSEFKVFYTKSDQLLNKRDDLLMQIADTPPDIILISEVIPKTQTNLIDEARLNIPGFNVFLNFDPTFHNLGSSNCHGIAIYI